MLNLKIDISGSDGLDPAVCPSSIRCSEISISSNDWGFIQQLFKDIDLLFVIKEPGVLRIALDKEEALALMMIDEHNYLHFCDSGQLSLSSTGREYFEPLSPHHTFWDLLQFRLSNLLSARTACERKMVEEFLDAIANLFEIGQCVIDILKGVLEEAHYFDERMKAHFNLAKLFDLQLSNERNLLGITLLSDLARYGKYCRHRMHLESPSEEDLRETVDH